MLARPAYAPLRASPRFVAAWSDWVAHASEAGKKARVPSGVGCAKMLNEALRAGPERYAAALDQAAASNWQGPHIDALDARSPGAGGRVMSKSEAATAAEIMRSRAARADASAQLAMLGEPTDTLTLPGSAA